MSIIAVKGVHIRSTIPQMVNSLVKIINGQFEVLNFSTPVKGRKICYIRLSEKLDPLLIVERIKKETRYSASIPNEVPDLPLAKKKGKIPLKTCLALQIPLDDPPEVVLVRTHAEIILELQSKYTGLFNLSRKTGNKLMESIAQTIFERLKHLIDTNPAGFQSGFQMSKCYRKLHPHFGDFQLILSTLHRLQDAAGAPRAQIQERELSASSPQHYVIENLPFPKVQQVCSKYSERIIKKISEHIEKMKSDLSDTDTEEDIARKKVRKELKKLTLYLPSMIKQVIQGHFVPQKTANHRVRIYGEPFLPAIDQMRPFLKRYRVTKVQRCNNMYNLLLLNVVVAQYEPFMALDGTVVGGAKLVIRSSDTPRYKVPWQLVAKMKAIYGIVHNQTDVAPEEEDEEFHKDEDITE